VSRDSRARDEQQDRWTAGRRQAHTRADRHTRSQSSTSREHPPPLLSVFDASSALCYSGAWSAAQSDDFRLRDRARLAASCAILSCCDLARNVYHFDNLIFPCRDTNSRN
jgi:hypothetical protein